VSAALPVTDATPPSIGLPVALTAVAAPKILTGQPGREILTARPRIPYELVTDS